VGANLALSLLWLIWLPLTGRSRSDWVIVVGTYFAIFILADVTTTNVLGADHLRVRASLAQRIPIHRVLLIKNLALIVIVGIPTLLVTAVLTITSEDSYRVALTLPGVAFPILTWLGVGNVVSVALPVATVPLRRRWRERRQLEHTGRWLAHLGLPYALLYAVDPVGGIPRDLIQLLPRGLHTVEIRGAVIGLTGIAIWFLGTVTASGLVRVRGLRIR
jgi:hypothetical protein